jgi:sphingolipid delta-4 desaturase
MPETDYIHVSYDEPHSMRRRQMLAAHPELRTLTGATPSSVFWTMGLVTANLAIAILVQRYAWYVWLPSAYIVGATIDHALWALIHEASHNLIFRKRLPNRIAALVANIPLVVPSAMPFFKYHLVHHREMGDMELDAGVPGPIEARVISQSGMFKAIWLAGYAAVQGIVRPRRLTIKLIDRWALINIAFQVACMIALIMLAGAGALKYLAASTIFAIGLHPFGARWIQEHFAVRPNQETYSYYGPLNKISFNIGYHNEHHDIMTIPWSRLPKVRKIAPEFYDGLYSYQSWTALLIQFIVDPDFTLFRYIVRLPRQRRAG